MARDRQSTELSFTVAFTHNKGTLVGLTPGLPPALTFTIPVNDFGARYAEKPPDIIMSNNITLELVIEGLESTKRFVVSSEDPDIVVNPAGIVTVMDSMLSITVSAKDSAATQFTLPTLEVIHLDSLQGPPQSAIAAGFHHNCALNTNATAQCLSLIHI